MHLQQTSELPSVHSCPPSSCAYPISCLTFSTCVHSPSSSIPFSIIARTRLKQVKATLPPQSSLFSVQGEVATPTQQFTELLRHARMLFGAGLGADTLPIFTHIIRSTFPLRWTTSDTDPLLPHLAIVDADLSQALQSCQEEVAAGFVQSEDEIASAKASLDELCRALEESRCLVETWEGEFCFDRGHFAAEYWRSTL
ncbi:hypothetical protein JB92DRAFT_2852250 [Gautieria morchelliformis]|nr:hypothetical protein JB92DRAFT_2852250 [Gautieria morchelliformis]